jgi:putative two-component system response regulator
VITGVREAEVAAEVLSGGADRYLFTPFGIPELQAHLMEALARRDRLVVEQQERRHLSQEARGRADEARGAVVRGARALVDAVETRDPHTRGHSSQVARYAVAIAEALGPEREPFDPEPLILACELHDIGKIEIAATVLNKEGSLTEEELDQVRRHPRTGRRILEPILGDDLVLAVTGWHHERWDGTGYPDGLAGEAIPLPARIVSIADALDAMTSPRAHRRRLEWGEAVAQILERAGSQFDPSLMSAFKRALPRLEELFRASGD